EVARLDANAEFYTDTHAFRGRTYYTYEVYAVNEDGQSRSSSGQSALRIEAPFVVFGTPNNQAVHLTWTQFEQHNAPRISGYRVERRNGVRLDSTYREIAVLPPE